MLRGNWGYVCAAIGNLVTLILLFQPWLAAEGPDGKASANAFGRVEATTSYLRFWSQSKTPIARITGLWAILATAAIIVTVFVVAANLRLRTDRLTRLATVSALAVPLFVLITLVYVNSKGAELKAMVLRSTDLGGHIGSLMQWAFGNGKLVVPGIRETPFASAGLTHWAILAVVTSLGSAVAALTQWFRNGATDLIRLPWRLVRSPSPQPQPASKTDDAE